MSVLPKKEKRVASVTIRITKTHVNQLKELADSHNISQADVIELLIEHEYKLYTEGKKRK